MTQAFPETDTPATLHEQALIELRSGQLKKGIALLEQALKKNPGSGDLHNDIATALWQTGDNKKAQIHFNKAIKLETKRSHIFNNYGYFLLMTDQAKTAERLFRKAIELNPTFGEAMNNLGLCLQALGKPQDAEDAYIAALRMNPSWPETHYNIGKFYLQTNAVQRAEAALQKTIELAPAHYRAWFELAHACARQGRLDDALDCLDKVRKLNSRYEPAWLEAISLLNQQGEKDKAEILSNSALEIFPGSPIILLDRARELRLIGRHQAALNVLENVRSSSKEWPPILFEKARIHTDLQQTDQAFASYAAANLQCKPHAQPLAPFLQIIRDNHNTFTREWIKSWTPAEPASLNFNLIFAVRFPGTAHIALPSSLLNQPGVESTQGIPAITNVANYLTDTLGKNYPASIALLDDQQMTEARFIYLESLRVSGVAMKNGSTVIDTSPLNIVYAGLIHRLFPQSSFIVAQMHPYDEVLKGFMEQPAPRETTVRTFDLMEAARLYGQSYRLWEHYGKVLPLSVISREPRTSTSPQTTLRPPALWETYQEHLKPVIPTLEPWAEKYGFSE